MRFFDKNKRRFRKINMPIVHETPPYPPLRWGFLNASLSEGAARRAEGVIFLQSDDK